MFIKMNPCMASTLKGQNSTFNVKEAILLLAGSSALCEPLLRCLEVLWPSGLIGWLSYNEGMTKNKEWKD